MQYVKSAPPREPLVSMIERLERSGIVVALGGSGLLAALGLGDTIGDWDLTTDASPADVRAALEDVATEAAGPSGIHADHKVMIPAARTEFICGFSFHVDGGIVRIPTRVTRRWEALPVGSPEGWAVAYALMRAEGGGPGKGRAEKSARLFAWLDAHGADPGVVAALLAQPLPTAIATRLATVHRAGFLEGGPQGFT